MKRRTFLLAGSALLVLSACSRKPETGPVPIRWDQE
ncbi:MAG TPA: protein NosL, partial [Gammaproteobacteria bacterium]|nr:protein NosL [Gammaproteobacteria bacterium]